MSDRGFQETKHGAHAAGSASEPAGRVGMSQLSGERLPALPANRALSLESVIDLARAILRPAPRDGDAAPAQDDPWSRR
jgi:hypothetical protein